MIILRKRVGSLKIEDNQFKDLKIINDSIILNDKILFNYLPIKNLSFFKLVIEKTSIIKKYWIYLDLSVKDLYDEINKGKIITSRDTIFEIIKLAINNIKDIRIDNIEEKNIKDLAKNFKNTKEFFYCFDKFFFKFNKIYFNVMKKIITINKYGKKRIKLPYILFFNNYHDINKCIENFCGKDNSKDFLFIASKNNSNVLKTKLNKIYNANMNQIVYSENINFQMNNYSKELGTDFINQLELESTKFFYSKKKFIYHF